jgi:aminocarboxymuconate-semialdehyde decarboxylase
LAQQQYQYPTIMLKIDIHTHIIPEHLPRFAEKFGYGGFVHLEHHKPCCARMMIDNRFFREIESNCWDPQQRIRECADWNLQVQVLSTIPVMFNYWAKPSDTLAIAQFLNDHIAAIVAQYPQRFVGLGTLPMQDATLSIRELERCMKIGLRGIQIGTHINGINLSEPDVFPIFEAAEDLGAAIFVHPWDMIGKERMSKYWLPWLVGMPAETALAICSMIFGGVFERFPRLRVAFAHGGGSFPSTVGRIAHGFEVRPDLCAVDNNVNPRDYLGKFYFDSLVHEPNMLDYLVNLVGTHRVALGTDYPFPLGELHPGSLIESMPYSDSQKAQLLHGTALEWLHLSLHDFVPNAVASPILPQY